MSVIAEAKALQSKGQHVQALALLEKEIAEQPLRNHLRLEPTEMFDLLEARAFSLEKTRKWNSAKADATHMIKLRPQDPRGYLRKGHIYFENGHFGRAAQMYKMAINRLEKDSQMHDKLTKTHAKLKQMASTSFVDPVGRLPPELLDQIFSQTIASSEDLVRLMLVSKRWQGYICGAPRYWTNLVFPGSEYLSHQTLDRYMQRSGGNGLHLRVSRPLRKSERFPKVLKKYHEMRTLHIDSPSPLLDELVQEQVRYDRLSSLKMSAHKLEKMLVWALKSLPSLETLELHQISSIPRLELKSCTIACPLRHLTIFGNSNTQPALLPDLLECVACHPGLETLVAHRVIADMAPLAGALESPHLLKFGFTPCRARPQEEPFQVTAPLKYLALNKVGILPGPAPAQPLGLEYLEAKWSQLDPTWGISSLISFYGCQSTLENLILERNTLRFGLCPGQEPEIYPRLRNLYLVAMPIPITTTFIEWVCGSMPELEFVNLNETPIDGRGIVKLVRHGVKHIRCRNPGSLDPETIRWAKEAGTLVTIN